MRFPAYPPEDRIGDPPDADYYNASGFRPAPFVGWKAEVKLAFMNPGVIDDRTGLSCAMECYEALSNWHGQFLFRWVFGATLLEAIHYANDSAFGPFANPPFHQEFWVDVPQANGSSVHMLFKPENWLRVMGYGDLTFNGHNHMQDWPK